MGKGGHVGLRSVGALLSWGGQDRLVGRHHVEIVTRRAAGHGGLDRNGGGDGLWSRSALVATSVPDQITTSRCCRGISVRRRAGTSAHGHYAEPSTSSTGKDEPEAGFVNLLTSLMTYLSASRP